MVGLQEDFHLQNRVFKCTTLKNFVLSNGLHGVLFSSGCKFAQVDTTKATLANLHEKIEVV